MLTLIAQTAYVFSVVSFVLFVISMTKQLRAKHPSSSGESLEAQTHGAIDDTANLIKSLADLTDSFTKAGHSVMTLVSAIFFLLLALAISSLGTVVAG